MGCPHYFTPTRTGVVPAGEGRPLQDRREMPHPSSGYCLRHFRPFPSPWGPPGTLFLVVLLLLAFLPNPGLRSAGAEQLQGWKATTAYPVSIFDGNCVTYSGAAYCVGGLGSSVLNSTYWAVLGPGGVGAWQATTPYPLAIFGTACAVISTDLYCVGGRNDTYQNISAVYYAPFLAGGGLGAWTAASPYPFPVYGLSCSASGSDLFCLGSQSSPTSQTFMGAVSGATIRWSESTSYPVPVQGQACAGSQGFLYCVGSQAPPYVGVYSSNLSSSGFSTWNNETATDPYPITTFGLSCVVANGYLYCVGGGSTSVYFAEVQGLNVGPWQTAIPYPVPVDSTSCLSASQDLYCVAGGEYNNVTGNQVYYTPILAQSEGATTVWTSVEPYPVNVTMSSCAFLGENLTCVGGLGGPSVSWEPYVYAAPATPGGLGPWAAQTQYPLPIVTTSCVAPGSTIYCVGGVTTGGVTVNQSHYANWSGGKLGSWKQTTPYPTPVSDTSCVSGKGWMVCVGGQGSQGSPLDQVYEARVSLSGFGPWEVAPPYPVPVAGESCAVVESTVYCVGNIAAGEGAFVFASPLTSQGLGRWVNETSAAGYPFQFSYGTCLPSSVDLFCVGSGSDVVYYTEVDGTTLQPWTETIPMPAGLSWPGCAATGSSLYCVGGTTQAAEAGNGSYYAHAYTTGVEVGCTPSSLGGANGSSTRCTATVSGAGPVGTVNWTSSGAGTFSPQECTLSGGNCSVTFEDRAPGNTTLTAAFGGSPGNLPSYGSLVLTNRTTTSMEVECPSTTLTENSTEACWGIVKGAPGPLTGGTLFWTQDPGTGSLLLSSNECTLQGTNCSIQVTGGAPGVAELTAHFAGNPTIAGSGGSTNLTIFSAFRYPDSLELACVPLSAPVGGFSQCTGTIVQAMGSVSGEWLNWSVKPGTGGVILNESSCRLDTHACSVTAVGARPGAVTLLAQYAGDPNNLPASASSPFTIQFPGAAVTTTTVSCQGTDVVVQTPTTCTVSVSGTTGSIAGEGVSWAQVGGNGTVSLQSSCSLYEDQCTGYAYGQVTGSVILRVTYFGDAWNDASQGETNLTVLPVVAPFNLTCTGTSPVVGAWVGCHVRVSGPYLVDGTVNWSVEGPEGIGLVPGNASCILAANKCSMGFMAGGAGQVTLTATYEGFPPVTGSPARVVINTTSPPGLEKWLAYTLTFGTVVSEVGGGNLTSFAVYVSASRATNGTAVGVVGFSLGSNPESIAPLGPSRVSYYEVSVMDPASGQVDLCLPSSAGGAGVPTVWAWLTGGWTELPLGPGPANEVCADIQAALLNQTVIAVGVAQTTRSVSYVWEEIGIAGGVAVAGMAFVYMVRRRRSSLKGQGRTTPAPERNSSRQDLEAP